MFAFVHVKTEGGWLGCCNKANVDLYCIREPRVNLFIVVFVMGTMSLSNVCYV